jgi:hypothetical protein
MRKTVLAVAAVLLLVMVTPAFSDELELGLSWTPIPGENTSRTEEEELESMTGFHIGYSTLAILYGSWESLVLPPSLAFEMTSYVDEETGEYTGGYYRPGFLNLYDVGIRISIQPIVGFIMIGTNNIWIYKEGIVGSFGANMRVGIGVRTDWFGVTLTGTSVFPSMAKLAGTFKGLFSEANREWALKELTSGLVPSILAILYL